MTKPIGRQLKAVKRYVADLKDPRQGVASQAEGRLLDCVRGLRRSRETVIDLLIAATAHPDPHVRFRAVWALGATRSARAYPTILAVAQDPDQRVRYDAVMALGRFGYVQAMDPLIDLVSQAWREDSLHDAAAMSLARLGQPAATPLLGLLRADRPEVRGLAAATLGGIGDPATIDPLGALLTDPDECVRVQAMEALARIGEERRIGRKRCLELIAACLNDPEEQVRRVAAYWQRAIEALG